MGIARDLIEKQSQLETERSTFEHHWDEVASLVLTRQDDFFDKRRTSGERRTKEKFDDTAPLALERGAAAIESVLTPRNGIWHDIALPSQLDDDEEAQDWSDRLQDFLFKRRYDTRANFASQLHETYMSLLAFGTAVLIVTDEVGKGVRYKSSHIGEHYIMENIHGKIDTDFRKYRLTARQAVEKFGDKTPQKIRDTVKKHPSQKFEFLHVVMPDEDNEIRDMEFISHHVFIEGNQHIEVGGFKSFPYIISRWVTSPNEIYGRSPAMAVLAEIKMLNAMRKTDLKARHQAVDGPILAADQQTIRRFSMKNGSINYGTLDANGNPLVRPYNTASNISVSKDGLEESRKVINDAFFVTLFQILVEGPAMTATEVRQRELEKGALLSPSAGRQLTELIEPIISREVDLYGSYGLFEDGQFLQMPESVKELNGIFDIEFTNPLARMQRSEDALAAEKTLQSLLPLAQFDPSVVDRIDLKEYGNIVREANGAPQRLFKAEDVLQAEQEAKAQSAQLQQIVDSAPQVAGAIKDISQAQSFET